MNANFTLLFLLLLLLSACQQPAGDKIRVILDTDANNELDDQHAIAYMLFNSDVFDIEGITVNGTFNGGGIGKHVEEAERIVKLCGYWPDIPVVPGVNRESFDFMRPQLLQEEYSGKQAVDFIIEHARADTGRVLNIVAVGSLTNVALAVEKDPGIVPFIRVVWLGSNWPDPGEYNLENDTTAVNPLLYAVGLDLEICTVRYGKPSGTAAVTASVDEIREKMAGLGPEVDPVPGRHGGTFTHFGDYSIELYEKIGDEVRSLFDVCALAIVKNPNWATPTTVPAPHLEGQAWIERPKNPHQIVFWENFDKEAILADFYETMERPVLNK